MNLRELPDNEKPRERLIKYGVEHLSNEDLISIILRTGTKDKNVKIISSEILTKIKNIENLDELSLSELTEIKGLGKVKAVTMIASIELGKRVHNKTINDKIIINNTELVHSYFSNIIGYKKREELMVILVDKRKRLINYQVMYQGTSDTTHASPKDIFHYALKERASGIIIMHNHPSGVVNPSDDDIKVTNNLISTGEIMGIPLLDHIITNGKEYYSFFDEMIKNEV